MSARSDRTYPSLAAMPGILVILTIGCLFVMHAGHLVKERQAIEWSGAGLEAASFEAGSSLVQKPVNRARARLGLLANEVVQHDGELFYLPDIEHVTGRSFLEAAGKNRHVVLNREREEPRERNPLPAIIDFDRQLRQRGIRLVLMPIPSKAMFAGPGEELLRNEGFAQFLEEVERRDIPVLDLAPHFAEYKKRGNRLFLKTDSHWTPETMHMSAVLLSAFLQQEGLLSGRSGEVSSGTTQQVTNSGDLAVLLEGGPGEDRKETIQVHPLEGTGGEGWRPDEDSPLLLLGDSFTNVFSLAEMGWGKDAGFAEALSQTLGLLVDRIARNADGAFSSRQELSTLAGRLEGKKVVVWQFAARELSFGNWKVLQLPKHGSSRKPQESAGTFELEGTIKGMAPVPPLTRAPYRQAVMEIHLAEVRSESRDLPDNVVLLGWGVQNRVPTEMTRWKVGQEVKVMVVPWREVEDRYGRLRRFGLEDPEMALLEAVRVWIVE